MIELLEQKRLLASLGGQVVLRYGIWMIIKMIEISFPGFGLRKQVFRHVLLICRSRLA